MKQSVLLTLLVLLGFACAAEDVRVRKLHEAEDAIPLDGIEVQKDSSASGGKYLRMEETGAVLFHVDVEEAGRYAVGIRYRAPGGDKAQRILINEKEYAPEIGFPASALWTEIENPAGLAAGANTIELRKSWGQMDIDSITVRGPISEKPEISPQTNTFYKNQTASDLYIQVEKRQNPLTAVTHNEKPVPYEQEDLTYIQDAIRIRIPRSFPETLPVGIHELMFHFRDPEPIPFRLDIRQSEPKSDLIIVSLDVSHGTSVLILLPTGKNLLIDTGTEAMCRQRVVPFLQRHHLDLNYLWITHYHDDHCGGQKQLAEMYRDLVKKDYKDFTTDEQFDFENVRVTILNSFRDGQEENSRSLSFRMEYKGFVYTHGGDIYGQNQERILQQYAARNESGSLQTHIYHANHHFHGSVDVPYLRAINPFLFLVSAEEHVYGRGAYTQLVQRNVLPYLKENKRLIEDLISFEVGHVVIRAAGADAWNYETYKDLDAVIPYVSKKP